MRTTQRSLMLTGLLLGLGASLAAAQHPQIRQGFWISFGLGYGSAHLTCDSCTNTTVGGVAGFIRLGGTLRPNLRLGGEIDGWTHHYSATTTLPSADEVVSNVTAAVYFYPMPASGLFLKGGLGISNYYFTCCGGSVTGTGAGFIAGLGYDIRVGRNFSITPTGDLWYGHVGDVKSAGLLQGTDWKQAVVSFGLGATFH